MKIKITGIGAIEKCAKMKKYDSNDRQSNNEQYKSPKIEDDKLFREIIMRKYEEKDARKNK